MGVLVKVRPYCDVADGLKPGTPGKREGRCLPLPRFLGWFFFARRRLLGSTKIDILDASNLPILPADARSRPDQ
jgi:hypothetical protein